MFRHPKTTQERRQYDQVEFDRKEYGFKIRARAARNQKRLPDAYDDLHRRDWNHRTWKRHRKNRWKG